MPFLTAFSLNNLLGVSEMSLAKLEVKREDALGLTA
jgi:hypothetical protein